MTQNVKDDLVQFNIMLPDELVTAIRRHSGETGIAMRQLVKDVLEKAFYEELKNLSYDPTQPVAFAPSRRLRDVPKKKIDIRKELTQVVEELQNDLNNEEKLVFTER